MSEILATVKLFESNVIDNKEQEVNWADKKVDYVGLYFSAHWCPPCKKFTPVLAEFYERHSESKKFEIVFVTCDESESSFKKYYKDMPWLAVKFDEKILEKLKLDYSVDGVPMLIFIDAKTGETVNADGRHWVTTDPKAEKFPWKDAKE
ncbi:hypothetical protein GJ496_001651 [Pomphorhynchus laevis]|nr:hypothetical protein GJ496_001651 [Pomphorhynchus laevis]